MHSSPYLHGDDSSAEHKQCRRLLESTDEHILLQVVEEPTMRGTLMDLTLSKKGRAWYPEVQAALGIPDHRKHREMLKQEI